MRGLRIIGFAMALWAGLFAQPLAAREIANFDVRGWEIFAYADDRSGSFSNCIASAGYESGMVLAFQIGADFTWSMAIFDAPVKLKKRQPLDISYQIDDGRPYRARAFAEDTDFILVPLPDEVELFNAFRQGRLLRVSLAGRTASFRLDGTAAMLAALLECAKRYQGATAEASEPRPAKGAKGSGKGSGDGKVEASRTPQTFTGSGFFVTSDGVVLTNAHVVEECSDAVISGYGAARITALDGTNDLALLKVTTPAATTPVRFRRKSVQLGESVYVMGFPLAGQLDNGLNFTSGIVSSLAGPGNDSRSLQLTAPIQAGNSGGPIVDGSGLLVGVTQAKLSEVAAINSGGAFPQNVNFGIKSDLAAAFLRANAIEPQDMDAGEPQPAVTIARDGRAYTVQVKCTAR